MLPPQGGGNYSKRKQSSQSVVQNRASPCKGEKPQQIVSEKSLKRKILYILLKKLNFRGKIYNKSFDII